jgi:hypothetical protein
MISNKKQRLEFFSFLLLLIFADTETVASGNVNVDFQTEQGLL